MTRPKRSCTLIFREWTLKSLKAYIKLHGEPLGKDEDKRTYIGTYYYKTSPNNLSVDCRVKKLGGLWLDANNRVEFSIGKMTSFLEFFGTKVYHKTWGITDIPRRFSIYSAVDSIINRKSRY